MPTLTAARLFRRTPIIFHRPLSKFLVAGVVLLGGFLVVASITQLRQPLSNAIAPLTSRQLQAFSELYLTQHQSVPHAVAAGSRSSFNFTLVNHEGTRLEYPYQAYLVTSTSQLPLQSGSIGLDDGQRASMNVLFTAPEIHQRFQIRVELPGRPESVHFWSQS